MTDFVGEIISSDIIARGQRIINSVSTSGNYAVDFMDDENFYKALNDKVNVDRVGALKGRHGVTSYSLYKKWLISPEGARRTV